MRKVALGRTGLEVSRMCLGGNVFGWTADQAASEAVLDLYTDAGGNFIDTAEGYSAWAKGNHGGESERAIGQWLFKRGGRGGLVLVSKVGAPTGVGSIPGALRGSAIRRSLVDSLARLRTDYLDMYLAHFDDAQTALEETLSAMDDLVGEGLIRSFGLSNYSADRIREALAISSARGITGPLALQPQYSLLERQFEATIEPVAIAANLGVFTYAALAGGYLAGQYRTGEPLPDSPRSDGIVRSYMNARGEAVLDLLRRVSNELAATPAQVAVAWVLNRSSVASAIVSARSAGQLRDLVGADRLRISPDHLDRLNSASLSSPALDDGR